jgi:hypothetical protein
LGWGGGVPASAARGAGAGSAGKWMGGRGWTGLEDIKETQKLPVPVPPRHSAKTRPEPVGDRDNRESASLEV